MTPSSGTIRRITRLLLIVQAAAVLGLYALALHRFQIQSAWLALLLGLGSVLAIRLLIVANNFALALLFRSVPPPHARLRWHAVPRLFLNEFLTSMLSSSWTMAFHAFDKRIVPGATGLPVLLIHGYGCNSGYWHSMSKALLAARISHYAIDLEPVFSDIEKFVPQVDQAVESICRESGHAQVIIVAHSMGGLVARAWMRARGTARLRKLITLGSPHAGTGLARFAVGSNSRQMRYQQPEDPAGSWLRELAQSESPETRSLIVSLYSWHDNIVSPQLSSELPGAKNVAFKGIGHVTLAFSRAVQKAVIQEIETASSTVAASRPD